MMGGNVCDHIQDLDGADIKTFCEKPKTVKCPQCTLLLTVISDGIYICLSCGKQACKKHIAVKSDACDCSLVHEINTNKIWCLECNMVCVSKLGDALFKRYQTDNLWTQRELEQKSNLRKCTELPKHQYGVLQNVVVLLVTANMNETLAARCYLQPLLHHHQDIYQFKYEDHSGKQTEYYIGMYGSCPAAISNVSSNAKIHDSINNVANQCFPNLGAIISVGVACGIEEKVKICDVLVSSKVVKYDKRDGRYLPVEQGIIVSPQLIKLFDQDVEWPNKVIIKRLKDNGITVPCVKSGIILSGPHLDDDSEMKKTLVKHFAPEAIGIEIEGGHLLTGIQETETSIIVVKAVCELVHGKNSKEYQPTAALMSADLVHKHLNKDKTRELFAGKIILRRMLQQAKHEGHTINVRHAKILFCGASSAGKTSFSRLLRSKKHETVYISTPAGDTQQVLLSGEKINVEGTNWISLDSESETQELTKKLVQNFKKQAKIDVDKSLSNDIDSTTPYIPGDDNKPRTNNVQMNNPTVTETQPTVAVANKELTASSKNTSESVSKTLDLTNNVEMNNATVTETQPTVVVANKELPTSFESKVEATDDSVQINKHVSTEEKMLTAYRSNLNMSTSESIPKTWDLFTLLDTGGQPEFINLLPAINTSTAITFIVLNMSRGMEGLNDSVLAQYKCEGYNYNKYSLKYTNMHLLKCLLSSVKVAAMKKDYFHPELIKKVTDDEQVQSVVAIMGTCADVLEKNFGEECNEEFSKINREVTKLVETIEKEVLKFWCDAGGNYVIPIDNTTSNRSQNEVGSQDISAQSIEHKTVKIIETIRKNSNIILRKKAQYEIPLSWFILELELRNCDKVCIHLTEVEKISNKILPLRRQMNSEQLKEVLKFYHMYGMLLYFSEVDGMKDFVITNPQWLFINLTKIIMCKFEDNSHDLYGAHHIKELQNGICCVELLTRLKLDLQGIELESFVKLLVHLKIIAPMMQNGYFMPTILPLCNENTSFSEEIYGKPAAFALDGECLCQEVNPLLIEFTFGTIPRGLFGFLVVQLLQDNPDFKLHGNNDHDSLCRCADLITFYIKPCYYVSLRDRVSHLELQVRVKGDKPSYHFKVQTAVSKALKRVCDEFYWKFSDCCYGFLCCQHGKDFQGEHLTLLSPNPPFPDKILEYSYCKNDQSTPLNKAHSIWFENVKEVSKPPDDKVKGINIEEIYQKFYRELVESLPSNDPIFNSHLIKVFCGDLKGMVESQPTRAKAATWFLDNAIGPTVKCGEQEPFNVLLSVMEKFGGIHLKKLAEKIKKEVGTCETVTVTPKDLAEDENNDSMNKDSSAKEVPAPTNVRATVLTPYSVEVTWDQLSDVTGYLISYTNTASNSSVTVNDGSTTHYILINLEQNTQYIITVQATTSGNRMSVKSNEVSVTTYADVPSIPPQNVMVTSTDPASLRVQWQLPSEMYHNIPITGHVIQYTRVRSNNVMTKNVDSGTTHTISGLVACTEYSIRVAAKTVNATGPFSKSELEISGENIPSEPCSLEVVTVMSSCVTLKWMPPETTNGIITQYSIQYGETIINNFGNNILNMMIGTIEGLSPDTEYVLQLRAYTRVGAGPPGSLIVQTFTPKDLAEDENNDSMNNVSSAKEVPAPTNVRATVLTPYSVEVTWDQLSDVTGYLISYTNTASNSSVTVNDGSTTHYILINLEQNTQYIITVQATTSGNRMSVKSNEVSVTTYADVPSIPPQNVMVTSTDPASLRVQWQLPSEIYHNIPITGHVIQYARIKSNDVMTKNVDSGTTHTIAGLVACTEYSIRVAAKTVNATGPFSKSELQVSGEDIPSEPCSLEVVSVTRSSVTLKWMPPEATNGVITQYSIQYGGTIINNFGNNTLNTMIGTVEGLSPDTGYILQLRAYTRVGAGPPHSLTIQTGKDYKLFCAVAVGIAIVAILIGIFFYSW